MADTVFETNNAAKKKAYEEKFFREIGPETYFNKFTGKSEESLVQEKTEIQKTQTDEIQFTLIKDLEGLGVTEDETLTGNEEPLESSSFTVTLGEYAHGVSAKKMHIMRCLFSIPEEAKNALQIWAKQKIDTLHFDALFAAATKVLYRSSSDGSLLGTNSEATAKAALSATNSKLTPNFIRAINTWADTGGDGQVEPIRPVMVGGKPYRILMVHPDSLYDLTVDTTYEAWQREAQERGKDNPLFKGAEAVVHGVIIHSHQKVPVYNNGGGASVRCCPGRLMGAQALCVAWGERPRLIAQLTDYERVKGWAVSMVLKVAKPQFDSVDFGSLGVYLACSSISNK